MSSKWEVIMLVDIDYVQKEKLGSNLKAFSQRAVKNSQTYKMIVSEIGQKDTERLVNRELELIISKYQSKWDSNLAKAYSEYISQTEITSLYNEGNKSPHINKLNKNRRNIGLAMQKLSTPLLQSVVSEALKNSYNKAVNKK